MFKRLSHPVLVGVLFGALSVALCLPVQAASAKQPCGDQALALLQKQDPIGYRAVVANPELQERGMAHFLNCQDSMWQLPLFVHEMVHIYVRVLSTQAGNPSEMVMYLPDGSTLALPALTTFPRSEIFAYLSPAQRKWHRSQLYLTGQMGSQDFVSLMDEYIAYIFSLQTAQIFASRIPKNQRYDFQDAMGNFMFYLALYLKQARTKHPDVWHELAQQEAYRNLILKSWRLAEKALKASASLKQLAISRSEVFKAVYESGLTGEIELLLRTADPSFQVATDIPGLMGVKLIRKALPPLPAPLPTSGDVSP